ncbi:protein of unknown function DUF1007 [Desulfurispirillum indicum S5]|uniref:EF-hand domain-containing protein n=2 Tax=Desulfurispirillum TaxID=393029 RepID=E6W581_DESIS|nr:protein of unknown function DUF1007 [Desulfurispirillum indicum S5]
MVNMARKFSPVAVIVLMLACLSTVPAVAHPHMFIDASYHLHIHRSHLERIDVEWRFDEMNTALYLMDFDRNGNGQIDPPEEEVIRQRIFNQLGPYSYFTHIFLDDKAANAPLQGENFRVTVEGNKLVMRFELRTNLLLPPGRKIGVYAADEEGFMALDIKTERIAFTGVQPAFSLGERRFGMFYAQGFRFTQPN